VDAGSHPADSCTYGASVSVTPAPVSPRFRRSALNRRARWRLVGGLLLLFLSLAYATWGAARLGTAGDDGRALDRPLVGVAARMTAPLRRFVPQGEPRTEDEQMLRAIVRDQQDVVFGLTVLLLRLVLASTVGGLGLVLLTAGSTEWELRSEVAT
jgi:hypothetical protein